MHVGSAVIFQNPGQDRSDRDVYADDLSLVDMVEPLGFESVWGVEHHFTDYTMCPDVMQFLTYMAGCTERIQLGSMVCVLPWHDPLRVAEQIAMLDVMSAGRLRQRLLANRSRDLRCAKVSPRAAPRDGRRAHPRALAR